MRAEFPLSRCYNAVINPIQLHIAIGPPVLAAITNLVISLVQISAIRENIGENAVASNR